MHIHTQILRICVCICICIECSNVCMHMRAYSVSKQDTTHFGSLQLLLLIHCVRSITLTLAYALSHTHNHTYAKGRYCSRWRIVIVLYTLTFLFTSFPVSIARMHYTHTTAARAPPASPLFIVSMFFYLGLFAFFLDSNNHLSTSPAPFYFAFSAVFYFLVTFILHLCCYEKLEGNIMLFRIIQLS